MNPPPMPPRLQPVAEQIDLLQKVKERLLTHGWKQRDTGALEGPNCLLGASRRVQSPNHCLDDCECNLFDTRLAQALFGQPLPHVVWMFNDSGHTTLNLVMDKIDSRIIELKERL